MTPSAIDEVEALVLQGTLPRRPVDFQLYDEYFRAIIAFWTRPTLDAQYLGLESLAALKKLIARTARDELIELADRVRRRINYFVLDHFDDATGGVRHALQARYPSLYGCENLLDVLAHLRSPDIPRGSERRRGFERLHFSEIFGADRTEAFIRYLHNCELEAGGFRERAATTGGVITTERGIRSLLQMRERPRFAAAHSRFLASCWIIPREAGGAAYVRNREGEDRAWLTPTRYCITGISHILDLDWEEKEAAVSRIVALADSIEDFIRRHRSNDGKAFSFAAGDRPSVVATWDAIRLGRSLEDMIARSGELALQLTSLRRACALDPSDVLEFLISEGPSGEFGWTSSAEPNLAAIACAVRLLAGARDDLDDAAGESADALALRIFEALKAFVKGDLFQCYPV